jgi:hypothetical protein
MTMQNKMFYDLQNADLCLSALGRKLRKLVSIEEICEERNECEDIDMFLNGLFVELEEKKSVRKFCAAPLKSEKVVDLRPLFPPITKVTKNSTKANNLRPLFPPVKKDGPLFPQEINNKYLATYFVGQK